MSLKEMEDILTGIMAGDNNQRSQAEAMFNKGLQMNAGATAGSLAAAISQSGNPGVRGLAAVLMRKKCVFNEEMLLKLGPGFHQSLKQLLLERFRAEDNNGAMKHLCDLIVDLASSSVKWPELFAVLMKNYNMKDPKLTSILYVLGEFVSLNNQQMSPQDIAQLISMAGQAFSHESIDVKMKALEMFGKALVYIETNKIGEYLGVAPQILNCLKHLLTTGDSFNSENLLKILVDIATDQPIFFKNCVNELTPLMEQIGMSDQVEAESRQLALEVLITIVEKEPAMVRKNQAFIGTVIKVALQLMLVLDEKDQEEWNSEYDHNVDDSPCFDAGQVSLCRLAAEISLKKFLPFLLPKVEQLMAQQVWTCKHAALVAVAQTCELISQGGINKDQLFQKVVSFVKDPHHRVRYAVVHCLGIMCTDFGKKFVNKWHNQILDVFMTMMDDRGNPRLQAHAAICVVNLAERLSTKLLRPNLEKLLQKLFSVLNQNNSPKFVQENVLSAICEVAENAKSEFLKYYDTFIPPLMQILSTATSDEYVGLRQEALRAVSYIGVAVGKQKFAPVALEAMKLSMPIMQSGQEVTRVLNSWKRIFKTLGKDAADLMPLVAEQVFKYATQNVTLCTDEDENDLEINDRDNNVNASLVEEKISAINLIDYMARYSEGGFMPLVERSAAALMPLIQNPLDTSIQESAVEALPSLVYCMFKHFRQTQSPPLDMIGKLVYSIIEQIVKTMPNEENVESLSAFACCIENLAAIDEDLTKKTIHGDLLKGATEALMECLKRSVERMDMRNNAMKEQGVDEEEVDKLKEENKQESSLSTHISDAVNQMIKVYRENYLPLLAGSMDALSYMLGPEGLDIQKTCALYIFCQVIECCSPQSYSNMLEFLRTSFMSSCMSPDIAVRQAGIYGVGVLVEKHKMQLGIKMGDIIAACFAQFKDERFSSGDVEDVQDNAAMTIGRVCKYCPDQVPLEKVYPEWMHCFPIRNDDDCSQWCYTEFLRLVESNNVAFTGQNGDNLPKIVSFIADAVYTDMSNDEIDRKFGELLNNVKNSPHAQKVFSAIPSDLRNKITSMSA